MAVDAAGNLYIADTDNHRIRKVYAAGTITTVAGNGTAGFSGDGGPATSAQLNYPAAWRWTPPATSTSRTLATTASARSTPTGIITHRGGQRRRVGFSGDGGPATSAQLDYSLRRGRGRRRQPVHRRRWNNRIRKVTPTGSSRTVAGNGTAGFRGDGGPATSAQLATVPYGVAVDAAGNLYIADTDNNRIRKVDATGMITTVAGNGTAGFSGDGGPATSAELNHPVWRSGGRRGNLYIADTDNNRIRKVDATGMITTVAGNGTWCFSGDGGPATSAQLGLEFSPSEPYFEGRAGVAVGTAGELFIADFWNSRIRKVDTAGTITTVAGNGTSGLGGDGGPATGAQLFHPSGVAVDPAGNLFIADPRAFRIRKVDAAGMITTVAGGRQCCLGDGGPATSAWLRLHWRGAGSGRQPVHCGRW